MELGKLFLFDATVVPHAAVLLFSGCDLVRHHKMDRVTINGWIEMGITELHCILYRRLQQEIEVLLRSKVETPSLDIRKRQNTLQKIVLKLIT
jgi:hypothetical protein